MEIFDCSTSEELTILATTIAISLSKNRTQEELEVLGNLLSTVGDMLQLIGAQRDLQKSNQDKREQIKELKKQIKDLKN